MSDALLESVVRAAGRTVDLGRRLLAGITPGQFARLPVVGGQVIRTNHPAFIYGHLSLYPSKVGALCGLDSAALAAPPGFEACFKRESVCHDDPEGVTYPPMERVTAAFLDGHARLLGLLPTVDPGVFARPNPDARLAQTFPTVGFAAVFLLCNHAATHLGQVSAWRRCVGLPPA